MKMVMSSSLTFFYKYILSGYLIFVTTIIFLGVILLGNMASIAICLGVGPVIFAVVICFIKFYSISLKKVSVYFEYLYVSNYFKTVKVPLSQIMDITETKWGNPRTIFIHLYRSTYFGRKVMFAAEFRFIPFKPHPVVDELKKLIELSMRKKL